MPTYLLKTAIRFNHPDVPACTERLVEAKNVAQAIRHVSKDEITCEVATSTDCVRLGKNGVEIEQASAE